MVSPFTLRNVLVYGSLSSRKTLLMRRSSLCAPN
uniref:Uncharacterized protein n=1 Tax=Cucumis melo TaxID=3656 RepID=A0A9I9D1T3_CUCME